MVKAIMGTGIFCFLLHTAYAQDLSRQTLVQPQDTVRVKKQAPVPANFKPAAFSYNYYNSLGAACKVELNLEKATKVPFRFRLGSLQQTDYMEQKPNAQRPQ